MNHDGQDQGKLHGTSFRVQARLKRREVSWTITKKLAHNLIKSGDSGQWCRPLGWISSWISLGFSCFPTAELHRDIVFVTLFCIAVGTAIAWCGGRCRAVPDRADTALRQFVTLFRLAQVHGRLGLPGWRLFRGFTLLFPTRVPVPNRHSGLSQSELVPELRLKLCESHRLRRTQWK